MRPRDSSATSTSDEEMPTTRCARILQRRGRARVRELVKNKNESMPAEARRLSALELKSATRKTSDVEAPELDKLLMQVMNLQFSECHRAWRGETILASVLFFFPLPAAVSIALASNMC